MGKYRGAGKRTVTMASFYEPSGLYKPRALALVPAVAAVVSTILGVLYAVFVCFNPEIYLTMPLLILWGFLTIILSRWAIKFNDARAPVKIAILVFVGSFIGYYIHLAVYCTFVDLGSIRLGVTSFSLALLKESFSFEHFSTLLTSPGPLLESIKKFYVFGVPDTSGTPGPGPIYQLVWLIELVLYMTPIVVFGYRYAGEPYEEDMQSWLVKQKLATPFVPLPEDTRELSVVFNRIAEGDVSYFLTATPAARLKGSFLGIEIYYEEGAPDACVTVKHHIKTVKRSSSTILLEYLMIPEVQAEKLMGKLA
jgi:hypothetical protein